MVLRPSLFMDFNLKQWKEQEQHESEHHLQQTPSAKLPKLLSLPPQHSPSSSALPLFSSEPTIKIMTTNMSACPSDSSSNQNPRIGSYFSLAQWQELELQAVIFRHMLVGAAIPPGLLHLVKKSPVNSSYNPHYFTHPLQHYSHLPPAWNWGRGGMDPEPTGCRRTDGKKWRCSRNVVAGHKYCERHVHRGRNRSRKSVEVPKPPSSGGGFLKPTSSITKPIALVATSGGNGHRFNLSGPSPSVDLLHLNNRSSKVEAGVSEDDKPGGQILRHFFDDWPRSLQESANACSNPSSVTSATSLSVSDFSLELSTGADRSNSVSQAGRSESRASWASNQIAPPAGGPFAEALRSSTSNPSPTSVLHH